MAAAICLPRQFQMLVVENRDEAPSGPALWGFPLYLFAINLFVLPIAFAGLLLLPPGSDPDMVVLTLPLAAGDPWLSLLAFIGGLSAATAMVVVESVALSTMVCNDLLVPVLLRLPGRGPGRPRPVCCWGCGGPSIVGRGAARLPLYATGRRHVRPGVDRAGVVLRRRAVRPGDGARDCSGTAPPALGALAGIAGGFLVWAWTLFLPSLALSDILARSYPRYRRCSAGPGPGPMRCSA